MALACTTQSIFWSNVLQSQHFTEFWLLKKYILLTFLVLWSYSHLLPKMQFYCLVHLLESPLCTTVNIQMMFLPPVNIPVSRLCYSSHFFRLTCYLSSSTYWSIRSLWARSTFVIFVLYRVQHCLCSHTLERCFSSLSVCSQILSHCSLSIQSRNLVLIRMTHPPFAEKRHQAKIFLFFRLFFSEQ